MDPLSLIIIMYSVQAHQYAPSSMKGVYRNIHYFIPDQCVLGFAVYDKNYRVLEIYFFHELTVSFTEFLKHLRQNTLVKGSALQRLVYKVTQGSLSGRGCE